jgi:hypothetical protein
VHRTRGGAGSPLCLHHDAFAGATMAVTIDLNDTERTILKEVLENTVSDLGMEIAATDAQHFREHLKERREVLNKVIDALSEKPR